MEFLSPNNVVPRQFTLPVTIYFQDLYLRANRDLGGPKMSLDLGSR